MLREFRTLDTQVLNNYQSTLSHVSTIFLDFFVSMVVELLAITIYKIPQYLSLLPS